MVCVVKKIYRGKVKKNFTNTQFETANTPKKVSFSGYTFYMYSETPS